jgi:membrane-associated phospholipid phosphatase
MRNWKCGKRSILIVLLLTGIIAADAQDSISEIHKVPITKVFYKLDRNFIGSFTYHYGLNFALAGLSTYGIVKSGIDWKWYNMSNDHKWIGNVGFISVGAGGLVPLIVPLGLYFYGRAGNNSDLQITGLAMGQAIILGLAISSGIKVFSGRVPPDFPENKNDYSGQFRFGFLKGGAYEGWPSTHTTIAFAMATTLVKLYPDNAAVKIGSLAYASIIGIGVSTNIHWFSDAVAGAFIGYAIGSTVGSNYRELMTPSHKLRSYNFNVTPAGIDFTYQF